MIILTKQLSDSKFKAPALKTGRYYWRVRSFGDANEVTATSNVRHLAWATKKWLALELLKPSNSQSVDSALSTVFTWMKYPDATEYRFILSKDPEQKEILKTKTLADLKTREDVSPGPAYWSVRAMDPERGILAKSEVRKITGSLKADAPYFSLKNPQAKETVMRDMSQEPEPVLFQWQILKTLPGPTTLFLSSTETFTILFASKI